MALRPLLALFIAILGFSGAMIINHLSKYERKQVLLVRPPENIEHTTFGYREVVADSLWIRVLQNFDACGQDGFAEDRDYTKGVSLNDLKLCNYSWVYHMINAITDLSPRNYMAYYIGGMNLSYFVRDVFGARDIYAKGLKYFPGDLHLLFSSAYHMLSEVKDETAASMLLMQAAKAGAPSFFMDLAAKLFSKDGRIHFARKQLSGFMETLAEDDPFRERLEARLKAIDDEIENKEEAK